MMFYYKKVKFLLLFSPEDQKVVAIPVFFAKEK